MKKNVTVLLVAVLIVSLFGGLFYYSKSISEQSGASDLPKTEEVNRINYDPPTKTEQASGDKQKEEIVKNSEASQNPPTTAEVVIVDAGQYDGNIEVRAFVSNAIKDGVCTAVLVNGLTEVTKVVSAFKDATTSQCSPIKIPRSEFNQPGKWNVYVKFVAEGISGISKTKTIEIK